MHKKLQANPMLLYDNAIMLNGTNKKYNIQIIAAFFPYFLIYNKQLLQRLHLCKYKYSGNEE